MELSMVLSAENFHLMRKLVTNLYARPFNESLLLETTEIACRLIGGHYSSFFLFGSRKRYRPVYFVSNNPPEFNPVYFSVASKDILLDSLVSTHQEYVARRMPHYKQRRHRDFFHTVQKARPVADMVYSPIKINDVIAGFWSMGSAGLNSPPYSDAQLAVFRFIKDFLNDALVRAIIPPPVETDMAYLDSQGHIISMGERMRGTFNSIFGRGIAINPNPFRDDLLNVFLTAYKRFIHGPLKIGKDRLALPGRHGVHTFLFRLLRPQGVPTRYKGIPYASVELIRDPRLDKMDMAIKMRELSRRYGFTPRENEVIYGLCKGQSNKAIAFDLGIEESTVKRHTHNIYEKSGFRSRVELVIGLSGSF